MFGERFVFRMRDSRLIGMTLPWLKLRHTEQHLQRREFADLLKSRAKLPAVVSHLRDTLDWSISWREIKT
jgi:hypothetical protein